MARSERKASYLRTFVFGVEDSLVSTVGLLAGIATFGVEQATILLAGVVLIFVEAFSMAIGSFLSESSAEEYLRQQRAPASLAHRVALMVAPCSAFGAANVTRLLAVFTTV